MRLRDTEVDGILEGLINSVKTFGLYPKGNAESLKGLSGSDMGRSCKDGVK